MILLQIDGPPVPWAAHQGYGRRAYNPKQKEREYAQWQIKAYFNQQNPIAGPVRLICEYHLPIPTSTRKAIRTQMLNGMVYHIKKPDVDNLNKFLCDCLKTIVFEDDSQVIEINAKKIYSESPKTIIKVIPCP